MDDDTCWECGHEHCDCDKLGARCPACGVPYTSHLGMNGTCQKLQEAKSRLDNVRRFLQRLREWDLMSSSDGDFAYWRREIDNVLNGVTK